MDSPEAVKGWAQVDPLTFGSRLARIPKLAILSSDDEFMQMDWSNIWYDDARKYGEFHLIIAPNSEHGLVTNLGGVLSSMTSFYKSIIAKKPERPDFSYRYDN